MTAKHHHFAAAAQYRASRDCLDKQKYGEEVARLRDSLVCVNEALKRIQVDQQDRSRRFERAKSKSLGGSEESGEGQRRHLFDTGTTQIRTQDSRPCGHGYSQDPTRGLGPLFRT